MQKKISRDELYKTRWTDWQAAYIQFDYIEVRYTCNVLDLRYETIFMWFDSQKNDMKKVWQKVW